MDIDGAGFAEVVVAPDGFEQLFAGEDDAFVLGEAAEEVEFFVAQLEGLAVEGDFVALPVEAEGSDDDAGALGGGCGAGAAEDGFDAGGEFAGVEGFAEVVVGTEFEADDAVDFFAAGGEHEDGDIGVAAEFAADFVAGALGHHEVEDDEVGVVCAGDGEGLLAVVGGDDVEAFFFEVEGEELADGRFVVGDQDGVHRELLVLFAAVRRVVVSASCRACHRRAWRARRC